MGHWAGHVRTHLFALLCVLLLPQSGTAQSASDGALAGRLLSADGKPSAYTQILAVDPDSGIIQRTTTGSHGEFAIPRLPPGDYILAIADSAVVIPLSGHYLVHLGVLTEVEAQITAS